MHRGTLTRRAVLRSAAAAAVTIAFAPLACSKTAKTEVVLYTSVDQPIAAPTVAAFEAAHQSVSVRLVTDTESSKSVGLATRLRAEQGNPICHVWWGNEVFLTIGLADDGFFAPLTDVPGDIAATFRDAQNRWAGVGLRARVMAVANGVDGPSGKLDDLLDARFKGRIAIGRPTAGTTGGHVAALYELWGEPKADAFFRKLKDNGGLMVGGNSDVADAVGRGTLSLGLTDNDDCASSIANGGQLKLVPLEQHADGIGTLAMPTTVALVKRNNTPQAARDLVAFLLSAENERRLSDANFTAYSVRAGTPRSVKTMAVTFDAVAAQMRTAPARVVEILEGRA